MEQFALTPMAAEKLVSLTLRYLDQVIGLRIIKHPVKFTRNTTQKVKTCLVRQITFLQYFWNKQRREGRGISSPSDVTGRAQHSSSVFSKHLVHKTSIFLVALV